MRSGADGLKPPGKFLHIIIYAVALSKNLPATLGLAADACDGEIESVLKWALDSNRLSLVEARVEYRERTRYFQGASAAVMGRLPFPEKLRLAGRVLWRWLLQSLR